MNRTGLRCSPSGVGLWVEPEATARSRNPASSSVRIAPRTRASVSPRAAWSDSSRRSIGNAVRSRLGVDQNRPRNVAKANAASRLPRVFPLRPFPESLIEVTEHLNAPRAIEPPVVVQPAPHHRVRKASQILQALVVPGGRHPPAADRLPDRRRGLGADRRQEADEVSPPPVLRPSRLEGVAEEVERDVFVLPRPVVVLAVDDPGLRGMKLQPALRQTTPDRLQHRLCFRLAPAVDEGSSSGGDLHPSALSEPDVRLSPHPAPTLQPPAWNRKRLCLRHRLLPRWLAGLLGRSVGSLPSTGVTRLRRYYEPVRPCASHRYSAPQGSAPWRSPLASRRQVPTFRTRASRWSHAVFMPVAARPVGRLPPSF